MPQTLTANLARVARLRPQHGLSRALFWLSAWFLLMSTLRWLPGTIGGLAAGLQLLLGIVLIMVAIPFFWGLARRRLLWSLRNKLVLTYLLFGLAPLLMLVILTGVTAYIAAGQFAIHLVDARVQAELKDMGAETAVRETQLDQQLEGRPARDTALSELPGADFQLPDWMTERRLRLRRTVSCFLDGAPIFQGSAAARHVPLGLAPWTLGGRGRHFHGIVADNGELYLVALNQHRLHDGRMFTVIGTQPMEGSMVGLLSEASASSVSSPRRKQPRKPRIHPAPTQPRRASPQPAVSASSPRFAAAPNLPPSTSPTSASASSPPSP